MNILDLKNQLHALDAVIFELPNKTLVPLHFHVTEVGSVTKKYIDCGGTIREERKATFQLWEANDFEHRLSPAKFLNILEQSEKLFGIDPLEVEVEYQGDTISTYGLSFARGHFLLTRKFTDCLAQDKCGIPPQKIKVKLADLGNSEASCCQPGTGCC